MSSAKGETVYCPGIEANFCISLFLSIYAFSHFFELHICFCHEKRCITIYNTYLTHGPHAAVLGFNDQLFVYHQVVGKGEFIINLA
jgi:hypothetical protein